MESIIVAASIFISVSLIAAVFAYAMRPRRTAEDVMMQVVGDAPYVGRAAMSPHRGEPGK